MGTYTTNYNLFMPTVGETGWGDLVNGNFSTIDTTMKSLSNRITAVENEVNGNLSCTSVTTSGKVTANGGLTSTTGTFSGTVTAASFNGVVLKTIGVITVTPTSNFRRAYYYDSSYDVLPKIILPMWCNCTYTGSIIFKNTNTSSKRTLNYIFGGVHESRQSVDIAANSTYTLSFNNVPWVGACSNAQIYGVDLQMSGFTLS